jgi:hypothetical protein
VNNINFEKDAKQDLASANDAKQLSDQVVKLQNLEEQIGEREKELKDMKREAEKVSGEVIPTIMQEMNISSLKLAISCFGSSLVTNLILNLWYSILSFCI